MLRYSHRWEQWLQWPWWFSYAIALVLFVFACAVHFDPDFGWHITSGQDIAAHGILLTDPYTYTASDFRWVHHEWLADSVQALVYGIGGWPVLVALQASMWLGALYVFGGRERPQVVMVAAAIALLPFVQVRAMTWGVLMAAVLYSLCHQYRRALWLAPLVFAIWANVHGSFIIGFLYLGYLIVRQQLSVRYGLVVLATSIVATFLNPYGYELYVEIVRTLGDPVLRTYINEWQSLYLPPSLYAYCACWIVVSIVRLAQSWRSLLRFDVVLFVMMLMSMRHTPLFVLFSISHTMKQLRVGVKFIPAYRSEHLRSIARGVFCVTLLVATWYAVYAVYPFHDTRPREAVERLRSSPCQGAIFNHYDAGGYIIWQLPGHKVYIDGRMPSWEHGATTYLQEYMDVQSDAQFRDGQFRRYNIRCVVWPHDASFVQTLLREGWRVDVSDPYGYDLLRR